MYAYHPQVPTPPDETILWRYIDLEKLLALLFERSLYVCRLDLLRDPWEGLWPAKTLQELRSLFGYHPEDVAGGDIHLYRGCSFVNCWHASNYESAALWSLYSGSAGVAIKSTCARLKASLRGDRGCFIGQVAYVDQAGEAGNPDNPLTPSLLKRKSFEYEQEVRVFTFELPFDRSITEEEKLSGVIDWSSAKQGLSVPVDLEVLIDEIRLAPTARSWLLPHVHKLLALLNLSRIQAHKSSLYDEQVY